MFLLLFALFILVPIVEITVIVEVSHLIGGWNAIGLLLLISLLGAWLVRHEGWVVVRRISAQVELGNVPNNELIDGFLLLVGGVMLLTPGFVTDAFGLLLVLPPSRIAVRTLIRKRFASHFGMLTRIPQGRNGRRRDPMQGDDIIDV